MQTASRTWRGPLTLLATSRKARRWAVVATAVPLLYVASFGPACWITARYVPTRRLHVAYRPVAYLARAKGERTIRNLVRSYARLGMPTGSTVTLPISPKVTLGK